MTSAERGVVEAREHCHQGFATHFHIACGQAITSWCLPRGRFLDGFVHVFRCDLDTDWNGICGSVARGTGAL